MTGLYLEDCGGDLYRLRGSGFCSRGVHIIDIWLSCAMDHIRQVEECELKFCNVDGDTRVLTKAERGEFTRAVLREHLHP